TTLLNLLATIDTPTSGTVRIEGVDTAKLKGDKLARFRRQRLGFVFQDYNLLDTLTLGENIILPLVLDRKPGRVIRERLNDVSRRLGIDNILHKYPYEVSGGQQQRAAAARAIIHEPAILLADEPTGNLDSKSARELMETFSVLNEVGRVTIAMVTHDPFAASYCRRSLFIRDGRLYNESHRGPSRSPPAPAGAFSSSATAVSTTKSPAATAARCFSSKSWTFWPSSTAATGKTKTLPRRAGKPTPRRRGGGDEPAPAGGEKRVAKPGPLPGLPGQRRVQRDDLFPVHRRGPASRPAQRVRRRELPGAGPAGVGGGHRHLYAAVSAVLGLGLHPLPHEGVRAAVAAGAHPPAAGPHAAVGKRHHRGDGGGRRPWAGRAVSETVLYGHQRAAAAAPPAARLPGLARVAADAGRLRRHVRVRLAAVSAGRVGPHRHRAHPGGPQAAGAAQVF